MIISMYDWKSHMEKNHQENMTNAALVGKYVSMKP